MSGNAAVAPYLKIPVILRELGAAMDLDAEKLINDEREAFKQAEILKAAGGLLMLVNFLFTFGVPTTILLLFVSSPSPPSLSFYFSNF